MESVRKGLRSGDITKDTYERLICSFCDEPLDTKSDPEEVWRVRRCPDCGREYKQIG